MSENSELLDILAVISMNATICVASHIRTDWVCVINAEQLKYGASALSKQVLDEILFSWLE